VCRQSGWLKVPVTGGAAHTGRVIRRAAVVLITALAPATALLATALFITAPDASATTVPPPPAGWTTTFSDAFSSPSGSGVDSRRRRAQVARGGAEAGQERQILIGRI
jgi:hypothetical protein